MKTLYFDCFAGASGNMILGALVALGVAESELRRELGKLGLPEFTIEFEIRDKSGIAAVHADVRVPDEHAHRHLNQIVAIISGSELSAGVKSRSIAIFETLARAEAAVHGIDLQKVHFHEVGALDAIIDIVGSCICFELLGVERFIASRLHVGSGFVKMAHGLFPVPPPAVAEILRDAPIYSTGMEGELMTPTGAAIIATVCDSFGPIPEMRFDRVAYGAGTRDYDGFPNALRVMLGDAETITEVTPLVLIETNLDDITAQTLGYVMERAFAGGALDCWFTSIQMKKNRPATMLSVLCNPDRKREISELLYRETTTLGLRISRIDRECLEREIVKVNTRFGEIEVKVAKYKGKIANYKPEFDRLREFATAFGMPLSEVESEVISCFNQVDGNNQ